MVIADDQGVITSDAFGTGSFTMGIGTSVSTVDAWRHLSGRSEVTQRHWKVLGRSEPQRYHISPKHDPSTTARRAKAGQRFEYVDKLPDTKQATGQAVTATGPIRDIPLFGLEQHVDGPLQAYLQVLPWGNLSTEEQQSVLSHPAMARNPDSPVYGLLQLRLGLPEGLTGTLVDIMEGIHMQGAMHASLGSSDLVLAESIVLSDMTPIGRRDVLYEHGCIIWSGSEHATKLVGHYYLRGALINLHTEETEGRVNYRSIIQLDLGRMNPAGHSLVRQRREGPIEIDITVEAD